MPKQFIFDQFISMRFTDARLRFLRKYLKPMKDSLSLRTAVDVGCGLGHFSDALRDMGFNVTSVDGRSENVKEAQRRYPSIRFETANVEDATLKEIGTFDLVFCFGLMYHLEHPLLAFRNLWALTNQVLLLESACIPQQEPIFYLRDEKELEDQGLDRIVSYPSEGSLVKMAYRSGFSYVYRFKELPAHEEYQPTIGWRRGRIILAMSKVPLAFDFLVPAAEPVNPPDSWPVGRTGVPRILGRLQYFLRRPWNEKLETWRRLRG